MIATLALAWGCTRSDERLGLEIGRPPSAQFGGVDAGPDAEPSATRELVSYCPSNKCPPGFTTCPTSRFPCDVNLRLDVNNCGACGSACPTGTGFETFTCLDGACAMQCRSTSDVERFDCDGLADNGCETSSYDNNHCGACGNKCTDPAKPCAIQGPVGTNAGVACGCPDGMLSCGTTRCRDLQNRDTDCGACGNRCDPTGNGAPSYPNAYYGCMAGACGALKCNANLANCDNDLSNGCETSILTNDNCGACGIVCPDGQACRLDWEQRPTCMCPPGLTFCPLSCAGDLCKGECIDLRSDADNCGACGVVCSTNLAGTRKTCDYGACAMRCNEGRADCNHSQVDGCEVDTASDPRNCGACGHTCDAVAGQACVNGLCVVEPCAPPDAEEAAR
ncbi:MAG: hypothetical protein BGO98_17675 [Myxococcales bacterium 68-20]|nr:MAG: hypothetical protein BGO98_17675 [Myxococcales bacterium 68-20]